LLRNCPQSGIITMLIFYLPNYMFVGKKIEFDRMRSIFFGSLVVILAIALLYLIRPFIYPIFWAAIIAILFYPFYKWIIKAIKSPGISAIFTLIGVVIILFLPLTLMASLLINESFNLYQSAAEGNWFNRVQNIDQMLINTPLAPYIESIKTNWADYATRGAQAISFFLFDNFKEITQNSVGFIFRFLLMLYTLYFFLKDGPALLNKLMRLSPLGDDYETMLYQKFTSTARATLKGTLLVGGIQGILAGLLFWATGVNGALILGVLTTAFAVIPALGSFIVWLPIGVVTIIMGNVWQGVVILIVGILVISTIDNFLRPVLVGKDIQMHPLLVLFSTLGGIFLFGVSGFIIGPILAALCMSVVTIYEHHYKSELKNN